MIANIYVLISVSLFIGTSVRVYFEYDNFFDTCRTLITDKLYLNFTVNFFIALGLFIVNAFLHHFVGEFKQIEFEHISEKIQSFLGHLLFILLIIKSRIGMKEFILIPIPFLLWYSVTYINQRITLFSLSAIPPTSKQHQNIATCQVVVFFAIFYEILLFSKRFKETGNDFNLLLIIQLVHGFSQVLQDIIRHIVFLIDRHNNGNSQVSFRANLAAEIILQSISFIFDFYFFLYLSFSSFYCLFSLKNLFDVVMAMVDKIKKFIKFQRLQKMLKDKLPDVTSDDLKEDSSCIICRNAMEPGKAKKLPCGHCFHVDCLERWVGQQLKCPTCQTDLTKIIDSMDVHEKEANNNNAGDNNAQPPQQQSEQNSLEDNSIYHDFSEFNNDNKHENAENRNNSDDSNQGNDSLKRIDQMLNQLKLFERELLKIRADLEKKQGQ